MSDSDSESGGGVARSARRLADKFSPDLITRIQHASYLFFGLVTCMILKGTNGRLVAISGKLSVLERGCETLVRMADGAGGSSSLLNVACYENTVAYRVSFSLAVFYLLHFATVSDLTCCIDAATRARMQTRFGLLKGAVLFLINVASFLIPNAFFVYYAWLCMAAGALFLLAQVVILVDWSHRWNEEWGRRGEGNSKWHWYLLAVAVGGYAGGAALTAANYYFFVAHADCNLAGGIVTAVLIAAVAYTVVAIWVPHGSIVPSAIVFAYTSAVAFGCLRTLPDAQCNRLYVPGAGPSIPMMLATAVASSAVMAYAVVSVGGSRRSLTLATDAELAEEDPDEAGHLAGYCYFYLIMVMGSMYLAMLVTDWRVSGASDSDGRAEGSAASFWVRVATIVVTVFLYVWSLLAPYFCCKDRDFGFDSTWE